MYDIPLPSAIVVNGQTLETRAITLADLINELGLAGKRYAVEHDSQLIPKSQHQDFRLASGMQFEIVQAVGGG